MKKTLASVALALLTTALPAAFAQQAQGNNSLPATDPASGVTIQLKPSPSINVVINVNRSGKITTTATVQVETNAQPNPVPLRLNNTVTLKQNSGTSGTLQGSVAKPTEVAAGGRGTAVSPAPIENVKQSAEAPVIVDRNASVPASTAPANDTVILAKAVPSSAGANFAPAARSSIFDKQVRHLNPLDVIIAHNDHLYGDAGIKAPVQINGKTFTSYKRVDTASGFAGSVLLHEESGDALVMFKGMDRPGKNEGHGPLGFFLDLPHVFQAKATGTNAQYPDARALYLDVLNDPKVKRVELLGFSMGTIHSTRLALELGAVVTNGADLGIKDNIAKAARDAAEKNPAVKTFMEKTKGTKGRIVTLYTDRDVISLAGNVGPIIGEKLFMPGLAGHLPEHYACVAMQLQGKDTNCLAEPPPKSLASGP